MPKMLNKFTKYNKTYKLDIGDIFFTNGSCFNFNPKNESKLPYKNYHRVPVTPNQDVIDGIKNGIYSNISVAKVTKGEKFDMIWYKVTEVDIEKRDEVEIVENELYALILNIGFTFKEDYELIFKSSPIKKETEKLYMLQNDLDCLSQYPKNEAMIVTKRYSEYKIIFDDIEKYSEAEDLLLNSAQADIDAEMKNLQKRIDKLTKLKCSKGLIQ